LARRATFIDSLRASSVPIVVVYGGDFSEPNEPLAAEKTAFLLSELERMGYDAVIPGGGDIAHASHPRLDRHPPFVASRSAGLSAAEPQRIVHRGGWAVGIFGLNEVPRPATGADADAAFAATDRALATFEAEDVDLIVLLSQLPREQVHEILDRYPAIDAVVMGHRTTRRPEDGTGAIRVYPHPKGRALLVAEFTRDEASASIERVLLDRRIPENPEVAIRVQDMVTAIGVEQIERRKAATSTTR
jgi:2',3'-cyclic-nucleotide 2'-phosphodiesterase (5'-nucleotidase family)